MLLTQGVYLKNSQTDRCILGVTGPLDALKRTAGPRMTGAFGSFTDALQSLAEELGSSRNGKRAD